MELQVTYNNNNQASNKDTLKVVKKLGEGKFSVYHVQSLSQNTTYALKVFPKNAFGATQYNKEILMSSLSHKNIIRQIPITVSDSFNYYPILIEFAKYCDFFELVTGGFFDSEILIRTYFHQLIAGLEYLHSQGVAHLDLKMENLMLGSDFLMKIIDFDQSQRITDRKMTSGGTTGYRAPEVINGNCHNLVAADIYSAGVILYAFKAVEYPFIESKSQSGSTNMKYYSAFVRDNQSFWQMKSSLKKDESFFSEEFKELVNGMLRYEAEKRFSIEEIKKSKWYNGPVLEDQNLSAEMKTKWTNFINKRK